MKSRTTNDSIWSIDKVVTGAPIIIKDKARDEIPDTEKEKNVEQIGKIEEVTV